MTTQIRILRTYGKHKRGGERRYTSICGVLENYWTREESMTLLLPGVVGEFKHAIGGELSAAIKIQMG